MIASRCKSSLTLPSPKGPRPFGIPLGRSTKGKWRASPCPSMRDAYAEMR